MIILKKTVLMMAIFVGVFLITSGVGHARKIVREADCGKDTICTEAFQKQKNLWLQCLEEEGISDKKRKKLSARVEVLGIRNLKKQEVFIFDSGRKRCHKIFYEALSEIPQGKKGKPDFPLSGLNPGILPDIK